MPDRELLQSLVMFVFCFAPYDDIINETPTLLFHQRVVGQFYEKLRGRSLFQMEVLRNNVFQKEC